MLSALPYEARLVIFLALTSYGLATPVLMTVKALRARRAGQKYVYSFWDGGALSKGRAVEPRRAVPKIVVIGAIGLYLSWGLLTGRWPKPDFAFEIPTGWLDVSADAPASNIERVPEAYRAPLRSIARGTKRLAVDIEHPTDDGYAIFTAGYVHGSGEVNDAALQDIVKKNADARPDRPGRIVSTEFRSVGSTRMARAILDAGEGADRERLYLYVFAKGRTLAMISCGGPAPVAARVTSICDATAESNVRRNAP